MKMEKWSQEEPGDETPEQPKSKTTGLSFWLPGIQRSIATKPMTEKNDELTILP